MKNIIHYGCTKRMLMSVLFLVTMLTTALAQDTLSISFKERPNAVISNKTEKIRDRNRRYCAKVQVTAPHISNYKFESEFMMKDPGVRYDEDHNVAVFFLSPGGTNYRITVIHPDYGNTSVNVTEPLQSLHTYDMVVRVMRDPHGRNVNDYDRNIKGKYTYRVPSIIHEEEARVLLVERAQIDAMAAEFGTTKVFVGEESANALPSVINNKGLYSDALLGKFIRNISTPDIKKIGVDSLMMDNIYEVKLNFLSRELTKELVDLDLHVLCGGKTPEYESSLFKGGNPMYISLTPSQDGYIAVYLMDANGVYNRLVPYSSNVAYKKVKAGKEYILLSKQHAEADEHMTDEVWIDCDEGNEAEYNCLYVIYSTNELPALKVNDKHWEKTVDGYMLQSAPQVSVSQFHKWLENALKYNRDLQVAERIIAIQKSEF